jgi:transcriptional regulator with XRE-family HTH domain
MRENNVRPIGRKIRELRLAKKLTQEELAKLVGCHKRTIENAEKGKRIKRVFLGYIATALEVEESTIVQDDDWNYGHGRFRELHALDDDGRVGELPRRRRCYYGTIESATLTIRETIAELIIEKVTMYEDPSCSKKLSSHSLRGKGPFEDRIANILYTADDQERKIKWTGVCVLSVPKNGKAHGYWMAAGQIARGKIVLGTLELRPTRTKPVGSKG